ncbi:unnamed protein product [Rotaria sp. Silwood2]|nr:unnamed protein product [Rotaria sp. Silwood2]CAF2747330.1 unnamed protein product [Rotaria sp. Silwood2]CAF3009502.1 unnamed protein product [Rotaria sp. Silwood2]CAF3182800.1 unnamed protein product [Rotaria sp. Silwood2]CAF4011363.1 unnamed protein product [Rotaria sp. Silwood2]
MLKLDDLRERVKKGEISQVVMSFPDMYGRLMGKRFDADFFLECAVDDGTHCCTYLLACDMNMEPQSGYTYANWQRGFGDFHLVPDWTSLRLMSWQNKTATVMCDIYDDKESDKVLVPYAPRSILRKQIEAASKLSYKVLSASELEYYTYENSYRDARAQNYEKSKLKPLGDYPEDYHLLQTAREEKYTEAFRQHLKASGVPVENSKGEAGIGQHELNIKFSDILSMADRHTTYKQCLKEVADQFGVSVTFMAKPFIDTAGSGCHIHLSMVNSSDGKNAFTADGSGTNSNDQFSPLFKHFLAGWLKYTPDVMVFYAPTINSYKRFMSASWAPTHLAWSYDNRTAAFRVVGKGQSTRIECRLPGADCNIYLAFAASLASGLRGIADKLEPPPIFEGDIYQAKELPQVPRTLKEAIRVFENSSFAREAFGEDVVNHYLNFYRQEQAAYEKTVTDWERHRYFEQI